MCIEIAMVGCHRCRKASELGGGRKLISSCACAVDITIRPREYIIFRSAPTTCSNIARRFRCIFSPFLAGRSFPLSRTHQDSLCARARMGVATPDQAQHTAI